MPHDASVIDEILPPQTAFALNPGHLFLPSSP
jgi:hypothetical protein